jgi:hypothetical protein
VIGCRFEGDDPGKPRQRLWVLGTRETGTAYLKEAIVAWKAGLIDNLLLPLQNLRITHHEPAPKGDD